MRLTVILFGLLCASALVISALPLTQDQEDVRGAFLTTRPKEKSSSSSSATRPTRRRPKTVVASNDNKKNSSGTSSTDNKNAKTDTTKPDGNTGSRPVNTERLGLGLTLFMRDANGLAIRTDPSRVFQKGDRVRVLLETNADGYLYIFNTTDGGPPTMIYPDADLDEAGNYLQSHVPFEIPSSLATEERLRWFAFDEAAGNERLIFVFTKEPLSGVPIEDELVALCKDKAACPVKPAGDVWAQVEAQLKQPLQTNISAQAGQTQTTTEQQATTRGLGLAKDDPQPSMIMMASSKTSKLVTTLDLIHK